MGRVCPSGHLRFVQAIPCSLGIIFADAEVNVASSCLEHLIEGDLNFGSRAEVEAVMNGGADWLRFAKSAA